MIFDGKLYLNLEKQVQKNKEDIEYIINEEGALNQFGLRVVGQVETIGDMPTIQAYKESNPNWEYGDAYMVGASTEEATVVDVDNATLLVLTRANTVHPNDFWMNLGEFPKPGHVGPVGPRGERGIQGVKGIGVQSGSSDPTASAPATTTYINATTGDVFVYSGQKWDKIGNIKGATGSVGPAGPRGKTGSIGPTGATGPQGQRGIGVNILGTLTSTSQLPDPTTVDKDSAYIIPADGVNHLWVIEGTTSLVWTDFGTAGIGEKGDKGDDGVGINTMTDIDLTYGNTTVTYDTIDGMTINGQARFTYDGGTTKDVTMDVTLPIVPDESTVHSSYISIDKVDGEEKVGIRLSDEAASVLEVAQSLTNDAVLGCYNGAPAPKYYGDKGENGTIVAYNNNAIKTYKTEDDFDAVYKMYADEHYVAKVTKSASNPRLYGITYEGNQIMVSYSQSNGAQTVAMRGQGGVLKVGTPVGVSDATTKAYVDDKVGSIPIFHRHVIQITNNDNTSQILLTIINDSAVIIDTVTKLAEFLVNTQYYPANGYNAATQKIIYGLRSGDSVTVYTLEAQGTETNIDGNWSIIDFVN